MACAVLLPAVSLHFYLVFPRPKSFVQQRPLLSGLALYGVSGLLLLAMLTTYLLVVWAYRWRVDAELVRMFSSYLVWQIYAALVVAPILFTGCLVSLAHSFASSVPGSRERNQVKWILTGAILATIPIGYTLYLAVTETERFGLGGAAFPMFAASLCFTLAYGISISRYGLLDVDKVLNWGIVSVGLSIAAGLVYTLLVFFGTLVIGSQIEPQSPLRQAAWVSMTALLLLVGINVFQWRMRKAIDRRLHRDRYHLDKTFRRMSEAVEQLVDPPTLASRLLQALSELLGFTRGAIYLRTSDGQGLQAVAAVGGQPPLSELGDDSELVQALTEHPLVRVQTGGVGSNDPAQRRLGLQSGGVALPLRHEGQLTGVLQVGPRMPGSYEAEELQLLTAFAQIAALALHGARGRQTIEALNQELRSKVEKISEQQRRIALLQSQVLQQGRPDAAQGTQETEPLETVSAGPGSSPTISGIVGSSTAVHELLQTVRKVAASPSAVLIRGESGTGKELLARALHDRSTRVDGPFVKVHCAALAPGLLESELFGHVKGAFTGAHKDKVGRFEMAGGGTLFLDEIGDISLDVQTKLLRVLQEMTFERVGSSEPINVDVRIIAATNQNLERLMREGKFREDLFYRLNVITIRTPPLRERRDDIYELALYFLKRYSQRSGKTITQIDEEALETLKAYDWPGNIRELENVIERAVVLVEDSVVTLKELPEELIRAAEEPSSLQEVAGIPVPSREEMGLTESEWSARQEALERDRLLRALTTASGNKARAARALGMPRSTFISKLEKFGLATPRSN
jgi:transcriptional regulator with GAF, ATPase, and Fis domain